MGLTNNDILKKLRVANKLRDTDIVKICALVDFKVSKELTNHLADALGKLGSSQDTTVSIDSSSSFNRGSAGLNYHLNDDAFLTVGMGVLNWNISALAKWGNPSYNDCPTL